MEEFLKNNGAWLLAGGFSLLMIGFHFWSAKSGHGGGCGMGGNDHDHKEKEPSKDNKTEGQRTAGSCH